MNFKKYLQIYFTPRLAISTRIAEGNKQTSGFKTAETSVTEHTSKLSLLVLILEARHESMKYQRPFIGALVKFVRNWLIMA